MVGIPSSSNDGRRSTVLRTFAAPSRRVGSPRYAVFQDHTVMPHPGHVIYCSLRAVGAAVARGAASPDHSPAKLSEETLQAINSVTDGVARRISVAVFSVCSPPVQAGILLLEASKLLRCACCRSLYRLVLYLTRHLRRRAACL